MILVYVIALAVAAGYLRGGRLKHYLDEPLRGVFLPVAAFAIEAGLPAFGKDYLGVAVTVVSTS